MNKKIKMSQRFMEQNDYLRGHVMSSIIKKLDTIITEVFNYFLFRKDYKNLTLFDSVEKSMFYKWEDNYICWAIEFPFKKNSSAISKEEDFYGVPENAILYLKIDNNQLIINSTVYSGKRLDKMLDLELKIDAIDENLIEESLKDLPSKLISALEEHLLYWQKIYG